MSISDPATIDTTPDEALAVRVVQGKVDGTDQAAFLELYQRYSTRVLTFLRRLGLDYDRTEDAAQETWQKVWNKLPDCGNRTGAWFRPWLFHVARNCGMDSFRAASKFTNASLQPEFENTADGQATPLSITLENERMSLVENCLKRLEDANQAWAHVFRSRMSGQRFEQICLELEISTDRAHRILFDAKQRMARCVKGDRS